MARFHNFVQLIFSCYSRHGWNAINLEERNGAKPPWNSKVLEWRVWSRLTSRKRIICPLRRLTQSLALEEFRGGILTRARGRLVANVEHLELARRPTQRGVLYSCWAPWRRVGTGRSDRIVPGERQRGIKERAGEGKGKGGKRRRRRRNERGERGVCRRKRRGGRACEKREADRAKRRTVGQWDTRPVMTSSLSHVEVSPKVFASR